MGLKSNPDLENIAKSLSSAVNKTLNDNANLPMNENVELKRKNILEYEGKLRVSGLDILNAPAYLSSICFFASEKARSDMKPCGTIIIYIVKEQAEILYKKMGYKGFDEEDDESMLENCGKISRIISDNFLQEISPMGYGGLLQSDPENALNWAPVGVSFCTDLFEQVELNFFTKEKNEHIIAIDISMAKV